MTSSIDDRIDALWDFNDPAASETRFVAEVRAAVVAEDEPRRLALKTQQARAIGLQKRFDEARSILDEVERSLSGHPDTAMSPVRVRLLLERGRVLNTSGMKKEASPIFERAWQEATAIENDPLAIDAAHMAAIASDSSDEALEWNRRAIDLADSSSDLRARRWRASLHNNLGWAHHERGDYEAALSHFVQALAARIEQDQPREILIARWCIARCHRSMGYVERALAEQMELRDELIGMGEKDGYVVEEIAECIHALGRPDEARMHFAEALQLLKDDACIEPARLKRLAELSQRKE